MNILVICVCILTLIYTVRNTITPSYKERIKELEFIVEDLQDQIEELTLELATSNKDYL